MFKIHFLILSTIFIKNVKEFHYFLSIDDETSMTCHEIMKIIHTIISNKKFEINKIINRAFRQLVYIIIE